MQRLTRLWKLTASVHNFSLMSKSSIRITREASIISHKIEAPCWWQAWGSGPLNRALFIQAQSRRTQNGVVRLNFYWCTCACCGHWKVDLFYVESSKIVGRLDAPWPCCVHCISCVVQWRDLLSAVCSSHQEPVSWQLCQRLATTRALCRLLPALTRGIRNVINSLVKRGV